MLENRGLKHQLSVVRCTLNVVEVSFFRNENNSEITDGVCVVICIKNMV